MQNRVRLGILGLPSSGVVGIASVLPPGVFINPTVDPAGFAQASGMVGLGNMIGIVSLVLLLVGVQPLYSILVDGSAGRWAFAGMILTILGVGLFLPFAGIFAFVAPIAGRAYLNGDTNAIKIIADSVAVSNPSAFLFAGLAGLFSVIGSILFGIAIWAESTTAQMVRRSIFPGNSPFFSLRPVLQLHPRTSRWGATSDKWRMDSC